MHSPEAEAPLPSFNLTLVLLLSPVRYLGNHNLIIGLQKSEGLLL